MAPSRAARLDLPGTSPPLREWSVSYNINIDITKMECRPYYAVLESTFGFYPNVLDRSRSLRLRAK